MEALIAVIIASALFCKDVISEEMFIGVSVASLVITYVGAGLYLKFGFFKFYYHNLLGWHVPDNSPKWSDGCSTHAVCKYCGREVMQDSQGNWF